MTFCKLETLVLYKVAALKSQGIVRVQRGASLWIVGTLFVYLKLICNVFPHQTEYSRKVFDSSADENSNEEWAERIWTFKMIHIWILQLLFCLAGPANVQHKRMRAVQQRTMDVFCHSGSEAKADGFCDPLAFNEEACSSLGDIWQGCRVPATWHIVRYLAGKMFHWMWTVQIRI